MQQHPRPVRRVVTGHDASGKSVVTMDGPAPNANVRPGTGFGSTLLWTTQETPARLDGAQDGGHRTVGLQPPPMGSIFRVVDFPPVTAEAEAAARTAATPPARHPFMHRTDSVDYCVVVEGEIDMLLDDSEVRLQAGDVVVQLGTDHAWVNRSAAVCRMVFVQLDGLAGPAGRRAPL